MKKSMRLIAVLCMASTLVASLSGCGSSTSSSSSSNSAKSGSYVVDTKHPITIEIYGGDGTTIKPTSDNVILKKIKDELGITFKFDILSGDAKQKVAVMIAGDDLPDMVMNDLDNKFISSKKVIPLEDKMKKYAPDVYKHFTDGNCWGKMEDPNDKHIYYMVPNGVTSTEATGSYYSGPAFWIQKDILKDAGYPKVTTIEQYFDLIKNYAKAHPTIEGKPTIGFELLASQDKGFILENAPSQLSGHPNDGGVNVDKGVASLYCNTDDTKTYFKMLNDMYSQGIVDRESVTHNADQYNQKIASGRVLGMYDQHWDFQTAENTLLAAKKYGQTYAPLALTYNGITPRYKDSPNPNLGNGLAITTKCKEPERVLVAFNLLMSDKWQKILNWGLEGVNYSIDPASKQPVWTEEQRVNDSNNTYKAKNRLDILYGFSPKTEGKYSDGNAVSLGDNTIQYQKGLQEYDRTFLKAYNAVSYFDMMGKAPANEIYYPCWNITIPGDSDANVSAQAIENTRFKWLPRLVVAKSPADFDSTWKSFTQEIKDDNPKAYLDEVNKGIQYRINNWSVKK